MIRLTFIFLVICGILNSINAQSIKFSKSDKYKKVIENDLVEIKVDTAYIVSKELVGYFNNSVIELQSIKKIYNRQVDNNKELLDELNDTQKLLENLSKKFKNDSVAISQNLLSVVDNLNETIDNLKLNNKVLIKTNSSLNTEISKLKRLNKDLKKQTRGIWWDGITDKLVVFAGGIGIGILIASVL